MKALLACTRKGGEYATEHIDEVAEIVGKEYKLPPELAKKMIEAAKLDVRFTPQFRNDMDSVITFMRSKGKTDADIDWGAHFDPRGLKRVAPLRCGKLGLLCPPDRGRGGRDIPQCRGPDACGA